MNSDLQRLKAKAEQGDAEAQYRLGDFFDDDDRGHDSVEAVKWWRKAAEQNHAKAQFQLGFSYELGVGVPENKEEAVKWLRKAAEQNDANAQSSMGYCYATGDGVAKDMPEAVKWWRKAAEQDNGMFLLSLGRAYAYGDGVAKDMSEALRWWRKAAEYDLVDDPEVQLHLGNAYAQGVDFAKDMSEAVKWWRKVAEVDPEGIWSSSGVSYSAEAQYNLGCCYYDGQGVGQDYAEAVKWYHKAALQNDVSAQYNLGYCYYNGQGVGRDCTEAYAWFILAAKTNSDAAKSRDLMEKEWTPQQLTNAQKRADELLAQINAELKRGTSNENGLNSTVIAQAEVGPSNERRPLPTTLKEIKELEKAGVKLEEIDFSQIEKEAEEVNAIFEAGFQHGLRKAASKRVCRYCGRPFSGSNICNDSPHGKCEMA